MILTTPTPSITLTPEQEHALDLILTFLADPTRREFKLGGYAGTGKTTLMKALLQRIRSKYSCEVCAFTGKAVNVLERKGVPASTMHSLMYSVETGPNGTVTFTKRSKLEYPTDLVIVDEASMVSTELYNDLCSFNTKRLFVGDPGQLEPVGDNPNLMATPDFVLSKIHRQAEASPIISLATNIRLGRAFPPFCDTPDLTIRRKSGYTAGELLAASQVICAKNKTRVSLNAALRRAKQLPVHTIVPGEKLMVLRNNASFGVFNGLILFVDRIAEDNADHWIVHCKDEVGKTYTKLPLWKQPYLIDTDMPKEFYIPKDREKRPYVYSTYGYVITCHKSQGSEWDHVWVVDEWMPPSIWDMKRWRYTAITRAAKKLTYCI